MAYELYAEFSKVLTNLTNSIFLELKFQEILQFNSKEQNKRINKKIKPKETKNKASEDLRLQQYLRA